MTESFAEHYELPRRRVGRLVARGILRTLHALGRPWCRVRIEVRDADRLAVDGPVIIAANHCSLIDTPLLYLAVPARLRRRTATVGGLDYFEARPEHPRFERIFRRLVIWFIRSSMNVLLIDRIHGEYDRIDRLGDVLNAGWSLMIFPEATRSRSGLMGRFRHGAAELAGRRGVPVLPVRIDGTDRILPPGAGWPRPGRVTIAVGTPIHRDPDESASAFTARIRAEIEGLDHVDGVSELASLESSV